VALLAHVPAYAQRIAFPTMVAGGAGAAAPPVTTAPPPIPTLPSFDPYSPTTTSPPPPAILPAPPPTVGTLTPAPQWGPFGRRWLFGPYSPYAYTPRLYADLDFLGWWVKGDNIPALITTSPSGTPSGVAGVLGQPATSVVYGDARIATEFRPGGRIQAGLWVFDPEGIAIEGSYYALATQSDDFTTTSDFITPNPNARILARPFFNVNSGSQDKRLVAYPQIASGGISITEKSDVESASGGVRYAWWNTGNVNRMYLLGGYRFFRLDESLDIFDSFTSLDATSPIPVGTKFTGDDSFNTTNLFNGGYVGLLSDLRRARWSLQTNVQLAMGQMQQIVDIEGNTIVVVPGSPAVNVPASLLAQSTNIGRHKRERFSLIPELNIKVGYELLAWLKITAGYSLTYVTAVVRPGEQIDLALGGGHPAVLFNDTSIWLQGFTTGIELVY
jgi:hypothetical protein